MTLHPAIGVGLRAPHIDYFLKNKSELCWLEIHSENYFQPNSMPRKQLRQIRNSYDISCHGIGLSLGSVTPVNQKHLKQLKALINDIEPILVSDHLSWSEHGGHYFNDLLPLPYTEEALKVFCNNVNIVQDYLNQQILIENPSSYLRFEHSSIAEWEFLSEVQKRTDCALLLDFNNIHVSAFNHGFSTETYLSAIDPSVVKEIHLAGFTIKKHDKGDIWIDTHSQPVSKEVWELFSDWVTNNGVKRTLIEWDLEIPEPEVLIAEAFKANQIIVSDSKKLQRAS